MGPEHLVVLPGLKTHPLLLPKKEAALRQQVEAMFVSVS